MARSQSRHVDFNFPYKAGSGLSPLLKQASRGCVSLISQLCAYDPDERLSAKQALRHPYFKDLRYVRSCACRSTPSFPTSPCGELVVFPWNYIHVWDLGISNFVVNIFSSAILQAQWTICMPISLMYYNYTPLFASRAGTLSVRPSRWREAPPWPVSSPEPSSCHHRDLWGNATDTTTMWEL